MTEPHLTSTHIIRNTEVMHNKTVTPVVEEEEVEVLEAIDQDTLGEAVSDPKSQ